MSGYASTGKLWKETAPHAVSSTTSEMTTKRLLSAKSTSARIMSAPDYDESLLIGRDRVIEHQGVRDRLLSRPQSGADLLHAPRQGIAADHFDAAELVARGGHIHPVAIVNVEHCRGRQGGMCHRSSSAERGGNEHAEAHDSRIRHLDAHLGGTDVRIEACSNVVY